MDKNRIREAVSANGNLNAITVGTTPAVTAPPVIDADSVRKEIESLLEENAEAASSLFVLKSANKWMEEAKLRPIPKMLFGEFWFEGEVCILFADTGAGKSILAVQIAESVASGRAFDKFMAIPPRQKVLYFDFELTEKQFEGRYAIEQGDFFTNHYQFDGNFIRAQINPESCLDAEGGDFESYLTDAMEQSIIESGAKVVIVDNLTYLLDQIEKAKHALPLMKHLKALKSKYGLSILVLAHTPKRDLTKPLTQNDLHGSKMLINFCDSSFAIGKSNKETEVRYLKQIKVRNARFVYNTENVQLCHLVKPSNFLHFELDNFASEKEHLRDISDKDRKELIEQVKELAAAGKSQREIALETGLSAATVNRYLKK